MSEFPRVLEIGVMIEESCISIMSGDDSVDAGYDLRQEYTRSDMVQKQIEEAVKARLDRVTELVGNWRALVQEDIGLLCGECVTNCADALEAALKGEEA